jgi:hypothetical protein
MAHELDQPPGKHDPQPCLLALVSWSGGSVVGAHLFAFVFAFAAPDSELFVGVQGPGKALGCDWTAGADCFCLCQSSQCRAGRPRRVEQFRVFLAAGRTTPPACTGHRRHLRTPRTLRRSRIGRESADVSVHSTRPLPSTYSRQRCSQFGHVCQRGRRTSARLSTISERQAQGVTTTTLPSRSWMRSGSVITTRPTGPPHQRQQPTRDCARQSHARAGHIPATVTQAWVWLRSPGVVGLVGPWCEDPDRPRSGPD